MYVIPYCGPPICWYRIKCSGGWLCIARNSKKMMKKKEISVLVWNIETPSACRWLTVMHQQGRPIIYECY